MTLLFKNLKCHFLGSGFHNLVYFEKAQKHEFRAHRRNNNVLNYIPVDGNGKKNEKQPWTEPLPDDNYNDICEGCRNDTNCRSKVTFNIDLQSVSFHNTFPV